MTWCKTFKVCDKHDNKLFIGTRVEIMEKFNISFYSFQEHVKRTSYGMPTKLHIYSPGRRVYTCKVDDKFVYCGTIEELAKEWNMTTREASYKVRADSIIGKRTNREMFIEWEIDWEDEDDD